MSNEISPGETQLLIDKLCSESVAVVATYMRHGVKVMKRGVVTGVSDEHGMVVAPAGTTEPFTDYLAVWLGSPVGDGCKFEYDNQRILPEAERSGVVEKLGDSCLIIHCGDGGKLQVYFSV
jgi:hypothetical protein